VRRWASGDRPSWATAPVLGVAGLSVGSGLAAFGVTAVIGDVAATFGHPAPEGGDLAAIGLPVTTVGVALAIVRLASLGSLPLAAVADRVGRRRVLLTVAAVGFAVTAAAAAAPGVWW
jgi:MFS family permease